LNGLLTAYRVNFINRVTSAPIPQVSEHGDFTPANILVDEAGNIQVIDWGNSVTNGQPLLDIGSFYFSLLRRQAGSDFSAPNSEGIDLFLSTYQQQINLSLPVQLAPAYYIMRMIERGLVDQHIHPDNYFYIKGWLKFLLPALKLADFAQTVEQEQPNEMVRNLMNVTEPKDLSRPSLQK
jgi:hypothetical protein